MTLSQLPINDDQDKPSGVDWNNPTSTDLLYLGMSKSDRSRARYLLEAGDDWETVVDYVAHHSHESDP